MAAEQPGKVIFCVLAGSRRYLQILLRYALPLLHKRVLSEIHLWNFPITEADRIYIAGVAAQHQNVLLFQPDLNGVRPFNLPQKEAMAWNSAAAKWQRRLRKIFLGRRPLHYFNSVYKYYAANIADGDIFIKCDNDVLYLNNLEALIAFTRENRRYAVCYPNIVNNDVGAYFQQQCGMLPPMDVQFPPWGAGKSNPFSPWWQRASLAIKAHNLFLQNPAAFRQETVHSWQRAQRVSINLFAMRGDMCRQCFGEYDGVRGDESYISYRFPKKHRYPCAMVMNAVACHYAFGPQLQELDRTGIYTAYEKLSAKAGNL